MEEGDARKDARTFKQASDELVEAKTGKQEQSSSSLSEWEVDGSSDKPKDDEHLQFNLPKKGKKLAKLAMEAVVPEALKSSLKMKSLRTRSSTPILTGYEQVQ